MDASVVEYSVGAVLTEVRELIEEAAGVARAAQDCADAGRPDTGAEIANDIDALVRDAAKLLDMTTSSTAEGMEVCGPPLPAPIGDDDDSDEPEDPNWTPCYSGYAGNDEDR